MGRFLSNVNRGCKVREHSVERRIVDVRFTRIFDDTDMDLLKFPDQATLLCGMEHSRPEQVELRTPVHLTLY